MLKGMVFLSILVWNRESISTADVFPVVANTRTKSIQKQVKSIDVDKRGSKKHSVSKSVLFRVELIISFLNLIFKQVRLNAALSGFLLLSGTGCPFRQEKSLKPGGGGTPSYKPYRYVLPQRPSGRVFEPFWSENGYTLCPFLGTGFQGNYGSVWT